MEQQYTLILENGTLRIIQDTSSHVVTGVFLTILFAGSLVLNVFLLYVLATISISRSIVFNFLLLHLSTACTLDCLFDISGTLGVLIMFDVGVPKDNYHHLVILCKVNAIVMQITGIAEGISLAGLILERSIVIRRQGKEENEINSKLVKLGIFLTVWGCPTVLLLPLFVTTSISDVRPFADRYSCGILNTSLKPGNIVYHSILFTFGYIIPWIVIIVAAISIASHVSASRRRRRQLEEAALHRSSQRNSNSLIQSSSYQTSTWSQFFGTSEVYSWDVAKFYILVMILAVIYVLLLIPHILSVSIYPFLPPTKLSFSSNSVPPELKPVYTGVYDRFFIWGRYHFTLLTPIIIFCVYKEVRKQCESTFCCCCCYDSNSIMDIEVANSIRYSKKTDLAERMQDEDKSSGKKAKDKYMRAAHYRTPVLFATSEGLHLRLVDQRYEDKDLSSSTETTFRSKTRSSAKTIDPQYTCELCDLGIMTTATKIDISYNENMSNIHGNFGASTSRLPHVFGKDPKIEHDLRISDNVSDYNNSFEKSKKRNRKNDSDNRKIVRFAQTVYEIPVPDSVPASPLDDQTYQKDTSELLPYSSEYTPIAPLELENLPKPVSYRKRLKSPPIIRS